MEVLGSMQPDMLMVDSKNKQTLSLPVGAVSNRTGLACLINSKVYH